MTYISLQHQFAKRLANTLRERGQMHQDLMLSGMFESFSQYNKAQGILEELKILEDELVNIYNSFFEDGYLEKELKEMKQK